MAFYVEVAFIIVIIRSESSWKYKYNLVEAPLSDCDSSIGKKSEKSPSHEEKNTTKGTLLSDE